MGFSQRSLTRVGPIWLSAMDLDVNTLFLVTITQEEAERRPDRRRPNDLIGGREKLQLCPVICGHGSLVLRRFYRLLPPRFSFYPG